MSHEGAGFDAEGAAAAPRVIDRRTMAVGGVLALGAALSAIMNPVRGRAIYSEEKFNGLIPSQVGPWKSRLSSELILPPEDELSKKLYENLQTRIYQYPSVDYSIMFLVAYSSIQKGDIQVHRPEVCYPVSGYPILKNEIRDHRIGNVDVPCRFLVADRKPEKEMILYWMRVGSEFPVRWIDQRIDMAMESLSGELPDGVLVRLSLIHHDENFAEKALVDFANIMSAHIPNDLHRIFFGK
ncbi:exosortase C-terminal domain/associated protein EpsI [Sphingopyxis soli]|uniref:exosortase C-terminal domain/associated protein EpsI n=1 Tax=Sphingopyxis soli TaxID=592051 RepID=UPI001BFE0CF6|nr:exosortase C-terminal domain/associated protein EpsI [Sphingopyxis soli]